MSAQPRHPALSTQRGFTLLEVMLAAMLGVLVIATCLALFSAVDRGNRRNLSRFERTMELSRTQRAASNAVRTLLMSPANQALPIAPAAANRPGAPAVPADSEDSETPRVALEIDRAAGGGAMLRRQLDGTVEVLSPQRFELALLTPPAIAEPASPETLEFLALTQLEATDRGNARRERTDPVVIEDEPTLAPGVRGTFEMRWDPERPVGANNTALVNQAGEPEGSWSLWWRPLRIESDEPDPMSEGEGGEPSALLAEVPVRLLSQLVTCQWGAVRRGEVLAEFTATRAEELPAYVTLEIETKQGQWHKWMFEVAWRTGPEPGTRLDVPAAEIGDRTNNPNVVAPTDGQRDDGDRTPPRDDRTRNPRSGRDSSLHRPAGSGTRRENDR